jgi:hypothetical protein
MGEGEKSKGRPMLFMVVIVVILIVLWILIPNIPKMLDPEEEKEDTSQIFKQYEEFEGENTIIYKNEALNVSLTRDHNIRRNATSYEAEWIDIWGNSSSARGGSPEAMYDEVLREAQDMTSNQIKWYEYMIKNKVE